MSVVVNSGTIWRANFLISPSSILLWQLARALRYISISLQLYCLQGNTQVVVSRPWLTGRGCRINASYMPEADQLSDWSYIFDTGHGKYWQLAMWIFLHSSRMVAVGQLTAALCLLSMDWYTNRWQWKKNPKNKQKVSIQTCGYSID